MHGKHQALALPDLIGKQGCMSPVGRDSPVQADVSPGCCFLQKQTSEQRIMWGHSQAVNGRQDVAGHSSGLYTDVQVVRLGCRHVAPGFMSLGCPVMCTWVFSYDLACGFWHRT